MELQIIRHWGALYSRLIFNILKTHPLQMGIFTVLQTGILWVIVKKMSEDYADFGQPGLLFLFVCLCFSFIPFCFSFSSFDFDRVFVKRNLGSRGYFFVRVMQFFVYFIFFALYLCLFQDLRKMATPASTGALVLSSLLFALGFAGVCWLREEKLRVENKRKKLIPPRFFSVLPVKAQEILKLNILFLWRRNPRFIVYMLINLLVTNFVIFHIIKNVNSLSLFLGLPFIFTLAWALDRNADVYRDLKEYINPYKGIAFAGDLAFWGSVIGIQLIITSLLFTLFGQEGLAAFKVLSLVLWPALFTTLTIKFLFLQSRFLRALNFALSIIFPILIPVFVGLFLMEVSRDRNS